MGCFALEGGSDLCDFTWSPDSLALAVWQGIGGDVGVDVWTVDGRRALRWRGEEGSLGVSRLDYSPDGLFLCAAGFDDTVRLFHPHTSTLITEWRVDERIRSRGTLVYHEKHIDDLLDAVDQENQPLSLDSLITDPSLGEEGETSQTVPATPRHKSTSSMASMSMGGVTAGKPGSRHHSSQSIYAVPRPPSSSNASARLPLSTNRRATFDRSTRPPSLNSSSVRKASIGLASRPSPRTQYVIAPVPFTLSACTPPVNPPTSANSPPSAPSIGVTLVAWSLSSAWVAVRSLTYPTAVLIYHIPTLHLHSVLSHLFPIDDMQWMREKCGAEVEGEEVLMMAGKGGHGRVYTWRERGGGVVEVPREGFGVRKITWGQKGGPAWLLDKGKACALYLTTQQKEGNNKTHIVVPAEQSQ